MKLFVFDFDGTLSDSAGFICQTMQDAFHLHTITPPNYSAIGNIIGLKLDAEILALAPDLTDTQIIHITQSYKDIFREKRSAGLMHDTLFEGSLEILKKIKESGHFSAIATGKSLRGLNEDIDRHSIREYFSTYQTSDTHPSKPHPAMLETVIKEVGLIENLNDVLMIGDTSYDMMMAKSAGTQAIGVSWGCHEICVLNKSGADHIIENFGQLEAYL